MGSKRKRWILRKQNEAKVAELADKLNISSVVAQILLNRGITTAEAGRLFFERDLTIHDPFLMSGMKEAVSRIKRALISEEHIVVYGDYDADGQTATALLVRALRSLSSNPATISFYLPDRFEEGYGLNRSALMLLKDQASLVITVDCGISSVLDIEYANEIGLDVIITDHHEPGSVLPSAVAILNPKQKDCNYPFKDLAGVGVAFKLIQGLGDPNFLQYLDLVALGTVADIVPLQGENRTLVSHGLEHLSNTTNLGLNALLSITDTTEVKASDLGFRLGPRLNAAGRLGDPARGVHLLLTEDENKARALAVELQQENLARQVLEGQVLKQAIDIVEKYKLYERGSLVVWSENWHQGVIGIVASRLVELYYLPTVVISISAKEATASARSIEGLDLYKTLCDCSFLLSRFGGHAMAAGFSLPEQNLPDFQQLFEKLCIERIKSEDYIPKLYIDKVVQLNEISPELIHELSKLEPYGYGNPSPLLQVEAAVLRTKVVGAQNNHLQLTLQDQTIDEMAAIAFGFGEEQTRIEKYAERIKLAFVPTINTWRKQEALQLTIKEWEPRSLSQSYVRRWLVDFYPWDLAPEYYQSRALDCKARGVLGKGDLNYVDSRGVWDKTKEITGRENVLILVNTPASVVEVCRLLRIKIAGGDFFIGFEHEYLSETERKEFNSSSFSWVVSTGFRLEGSTWSTICFWEPPLTEAVEYSWLSLCEEGGDLVALFGPKDVRKLQANLVRYYPDRKGLARIYAELRSPSGKILIEEASRLLASMEILGALPIALGIFSELALWEVTEGEILYLSPPTQKLDLEQSVLYNKTIKMRQQSAQYLKRCLERGFFQDGLKRKN